MWVVDKEKERQRDQLLNEVGGIVSRLSQQITRSEQVESEFAYTTSGAPSGLGDVMIEDCRIARDQLSRALQDLQASEDCLHRVDIMKWVDDGDGA